MKCIECGKIDQPTEKSICDACNKAIDKGINPKIIAITVVASFAFAYYLFQESFLAFIFGIMVGALATLELIRRFKKK